MDTHQILQILILVVGFYMAWNIGANDVSNAMGTSVGSGALTLVKAVFIASILEFSGAYFLGANVSKTLQRGLIDLDFFINDPTLLMIGMCSALLGTSLWLQLASFFGWPVSTTHAIVGSIIGFGAVIGGIETVKWAEVGSIAVSWVVSPLASAFLSYFFFYVVQRKILFALNPKEATKQIMPWLIALFVVVIALSLSFKGIARINFYPTFSQALLASIGASTLAGVICWIVLRLRKNKEISPLAANPLHTPQSLVCLEKALKHLHRFQNTSASAASTHRMDHMIGELQSLTHTVRQEARFFERSSEYSLVEKRFGHLQIASACFVAFAHGANDVANAIGPIAVVLDILETGAINDQAPIPAWLLALGGIGIVIGILTWGWRVIETIGKKITQLTPTRGFCAEFGAATTILIASQLGLPISTTHCLVGSVLGVGLARGFKALNLGMLKEIFLSWVITLPASAVMSVLCFFLLKKLLLS